MQRARSNSATISTSGTAWRAARCDVEVFSGPIAVGGRELLYSIIHDVTERTRATEALQETKAHRS